MADEDVWSQHSSDYGDSNLEDAYTDENEVAFGESILEDAYVDQNEVATQRNKPGPKVITNETLLAAQSEDLLRVVDVLGLQPRHARTLLIFHRWNVEGIFEKLGDKGEEVVFQEAGLLCGAASTSSEISTNRTAVVICGTCLEEVLQNTVTRMDCGHSFCDNCWIEYFIMKIKESQSRRMTCMEYKCAVICDEDQVRRLVGSKDPESADRYERFLLESYIEDNSKVQWCPSTPHCGNAIRVEGERYCEVQCTCGQQFCFNCLAEPHSPCSCIMWQLWQKICKDGNWLKRQIKPCPKCNKPVEKDGGCDRVLCPCGEKFCWLCGRKYGHCNGDHSSARYRKKEKEYRKEKQKKWVSKERNLENYLHIMHYHSRWKGHEDLKFTQQEVTKKIAALEASDLSVKDFTWLYAGLERLLQAQRALSFSFVFAFFMFGNDIFKDEISEEQNEINQNRFDDLQTQLEETVERLSKLVETPLDGYTDNVSVNEMRLEVIDLTTVLDWRCKNLYDIIQNDLLGSLQVRTHHVAPYQWGVERASEIDRGKN